MRKSYLLIIALICFTGYTFAQNSIGGIPPSFNQLTENRASIDVKIVPQPDMQKIALEDDIDAKSGQLYKIGRSVAVNFDMNTAGTWTNLPEGGRIWRLKISCNDAHGLVVYYNNFYIPRNGKLFLYNEAKTQVIGAFTSENNTDNGIFATEMTEGQTVTLEYVQPSRSIEKAIINISEIGYIYRDTHFLFNQLRAFGDAETCHPNINCSPEGDNWQDEKKGVARILLTAGGSQGWCSGTLINNTAQDCKKYFLTADHCAEGATTTELNSWIFYFNYEASSCTTPGTQPSFKTMIGCTLKANGGNGGASGSDFFLVELKTANFPSGLVPYFNGWNRSTSATAGGVSIHHPMGDIKKISTFNGTPVSSTWGSAAGSHWRVTWSATTNGTGVTEPGSSGSPLFDSNGRVIGDLTGGGSYCSATTQPDYYGKFSYSWQSNGSTSATQLKPWLDPSNSGVTTLDGILSPCVTSNPPVANFIANSTSITEGGSVIFTDLSTNTPTSWSWAFSGGTPSTSSLQNPSITYSAAGTYNVSLTATNAYGSDAEVKTAYITVSPQGTATCDTLTNFTGTPTVYGVQSPQSGYLSGNNSYGDLSKAEYFATYTPYTKIDKAIVYFGVAKGGSSNITFNILNQSASKPGTVVATATVSLTTIKANVTASLPTEVDFVPDVTIPGPFYFEVVLPTAAGDTLAIITNTDGDGAANTGWEKWSGGGGWYEYSSTSAWGVSLNHAISVLACTESTGVAPVANFSGTPTSLSAGGSVVFTDLSTNTPTSWSWAFSGGTPSTSSLQNPTITYSTAGTYNVSLTATNTTGSDLETKTAYITVTAGVAPVANFSGTPTTLNAGGSVAFTDLSTNTPTSWLWTFTGGTPTSSTLQNPTGIVYSAVGTYNVSLKATNAYGNNTSTKNAYITVTQNTQNGFTLDFEASTDFATTFTPWTVNDVDGSTTYGIDGTTFTGSGSAMAYIAFNPASTTPSLSGDTELQPHGGSRFGASFAATTPPNNDWLISNQLQLGSSSNLTLWVKSYTSQYGLERYKIGVSTTNNSPSSFTIISAGTYEEATTTWTEKTYDLFAYNNQQVYIGINCVSNDAFIFMVDDIAINTITANESITNINNNNLVSIFPNPTNDFINVVISENIKGNYSISIYNILGDVINIIEKPSIDRSTQINMTNYASGLYFMNINVDGKTLTKRISLQK